MFRQNAVYNGRVMSDTAFIEAYKRLNQKQKEDVDTIEGPVMVIAGPGTGKTTILTLRIAQVLRKTDTRGRLVRVLSVQGKM